MLITTKRFFYGATELQFLTSRLRSLQDVKFCQVCIPLKIHAYNPEMVLLWCNGATISDVAPLGSIAPFGVNYARNTQRLRKANFVKYISH